MKPIQAAPSSVFEKPWSLTPLKGTESPRIARHFAALMFVLLLMTLAVLIWMPWQQNLRGTGEVIAFSPLERSQEIEAPINGRVMRWYVSEGSKVNKGDLIAEMADNDPDYMSRLQQQRQSLMNQLSMNEAKVLAYDLRVQDYQSALSGTTLAAQAKFDASQAKLDAARRELDAEQAALEANRLNLERESALQAKGLSSARTLELAQLSYQKSMADVRKDLAKIKECESDVTAAAAEKTKAEASARATLNSSRATLEESRTSVEKMRAELAKLDTLMARQANQTIRAPLAGTILKLTTFADTVYAKAGDKLAVLVPDTQERAVELYMNGNDIPLIQPGREVRLQFEGWPALQFAGWPSVAVGTFGAEVVLVDATDDSKGKFRIVVRPRAQDQWPAAAYLRQGVRANGWVLLDTVPLGYELWRQFNGFPASVKDSPAKTESNNVIKRKSKK